jgi:thiaminase/transcriptional activator TenA
MRYTDELRIKAGKQWDRVINHRFTKELATAGGSGGGRIATKNETNHFKNCIMKKYLIQDHRFLDSFVILLASIITKLSCLNDRIAGCQFLGVITGSENTYFERSFATLGITKEERSEEITPNSKTTTKFCSLMKDVALSGNLEEMLAVIVVCEWSYLSWADILLNEDFHIENCKINRDDFLTYEWIQLHSGFEFENVVQYLRELLDREGTKLKAEVLENGNKSTLGASSQIRLDACEKRFLQTIQLEEDFFDHLYDIKQEENNNDNHKKQKMNDNKL